jgi:large subunit ribosomal protein L5
MEKLAENFNKVILNDLQKSLGKKNIFEIPRIEKVVISSGIGAFKEDENMIKKIIADITAITGQKPKTNRAHKAVSAFKLRIGQPVGVTTTLRGQKMFDFIDMLVKVAIPRVRDFRGLSKNAFDKHGNYTVGIKDHSIFPEIRHDEKTISFGFQINIKTTTQSDSEARALLEKLGFPFEKKLTPTQKDGAKE